MIDVYFISLLNRHKERFPSSTERLDSTPSHNASVGGAKASFHLLGKAADLTFDLSQDLIPAAKYAIELGFNGVEVDFRNNHLHLDTRLTPWHVVCVKSGYIDFDKYLTQET